MFKDKKYKPIVYPSFAVTSVCVTIIQNTLSYSIIQFSYLILYCGGINQYFRTKMHLTLNVISYPCISRDLRGLFIGEIC